MNTKLSPIPFFLLLLVVGLPTVWAKSDLSSNYPPGDEICNDGNQNTVGSGDTSFGTSVAVNRRSIVVGAPFDDVGGHVYIFSSTGCMIARIASPKAQFTGEGFGLSLAVSNRDVVIGSPYENEGGFALAGHAYIFSSTGRLIANLTSPNPHDGGYFGSSVALNGSAVVVGSPIDGRVYIFSITGSLIASLTSHHSDGFGYFGFSVAMSDSNVVVGAPFEGEGGHVYIFNSSGSMITTLTSPNPQLTGEGFGLSVAVSRTNVVVGSPIEGRVYIFSITGSLIASLTSHHPYGEFGSSVAVSDRNVVVSAPLEGAVFLGHVYIFSSSGSMITTLTSPNPQPAGPAPGNGEFGFSVALSGTRVVVGVPSNNGGAVYIFSSTGRLIAILTSPDSQAG